MAVACSLLRQRPSGLLQPVPGLIAVSIAASTMALLLLSSCLLFCACHGQGPAGAGFLSETVEDDFLYSFLATGSQAESQGLGMGGKERLPELLRTGSGSIESVTAAAAAAEVAAVAAVAAAASAAAAAVGPQKQSHDQLLLRSQLSQFPTAGIVSDSETSPLDTSGSSSSSSSKSNGNKVQHSGPQLQLRPPDPRPPLSKPLETTIGWEFCRQLAQSILSSGNTSKESSRTKRRRSTHRQLWRAMGGQLPRRTRHSRRRHLSEAQRVRLSPKTQRWRLSSKSRRKSRARSTTHRRPSQTLPFPGNSRGHGSGSSSSSNGSEKELSASGMQQLPMHPTNPRPRSSEPSLGKGEKPFPCFTDSISGSKLAPGAAVREFRRVLHCWSNRGRWVYRPEPRLLPWRPSGLSICDARWTQSTSIIESPRAKDSPPGLAGEGVNVLVRRKKVTVGTWRVRDVLKYRWEVDPRECGGLNAEEGDATAAATAARPRTLPLNLEAGISIPESQRLLSHFNRQWMCWAMQKLGGSILMVGDSLTHQFMRSIYNHMSLDAPEGRARGGRGRGSGKGGKVELRTPPPCDEWEAERKMKSFMRLCRVVTGCDDIDRKLAVYHARNDRLSLLDGEPVEEKWEFYLPWLSLIERFGIQILVLNRGAHWTPTDEFKIQLEMTLQGLRQRYPDILLIYRSATSGHLHCENFTAPLPRLQNLEDLPYHWGTFREQNRLAKEMVERYGGVYLDVEFLTGLRADGHMEHALGKYDCLHYCEPGPMDTWVLLLYNVLLRLI